MSKCDAILKTAFIVEDAHARVCVCVCVCVCVLVCVYRLNVLGTGSCSSQQRNIYVNTIWKL
jgi:hypothetical protein